MFAYFIKRRRRIGYFVTATALALYLAWDILESKEKCQCAPSFILLERQIIAGNTRLGSAVRKTMRHMKEKLPREPGAQCCRLKDRRAKLCTKRRQTV